MLAAMEADTIALVVLAVAGAFAADAWLAPRIRSRRWRERVVNLSCGFTRYAAGALVNGAFLGAYAWLLDVTPLALPAASPLAWGLAFLAFDFLIFVTHFLSHRVPVLWAIHAVHHQPEEIDVTVGLRTHVLTSLFYLPLLLPLAALGVPLAVFLPLAAVRLAAMALTHTRLRTPRWLDRYVNTPELHAVHHSADPRHYDKNIGGILMLWDHLLGTYAPREPVARCGLPGPAPRHALEANWLPFRPARPVHLARTRRLPALMLAVLLPPMLAACATLGLPTGQAWRLELEESGSRPVIVDDVLYIGTGDGQVVAVDAASGSVRWRFQTGERIPAGAQIIDVPAGTHRTTAVRDALEERRRRGYRRVDMTPRVESGTVFVGSGDGSFYALDAQSGRPRWSHLVGPGMSVGRTVDLGAASFGDGALYFAAADAVHAVDAVSGEERWRFETLQELPPRAKYQDPGIPDLVLADGTIFVTQFRKVFQTSESSSFAYAIDPASGRERWARRFEGLVSAPIVAGGLLVISVKGKDHDVTLHALDCASGEVRWTYCARVKFFVPGVLVAGDTVFVAAGTRVLALDLATGRERWSHAAEEVGYSLAADARRLYFVSSRSSLLGETNTLRALDLASGALQWSARLRGAVVVGGVHEGVVYATGGGRLEAIDAATGRALGSVTAITAFSDPAFAGGRLYVTTPTVRYVGSTRVDQGYLHAIDVAVPGAE
jgi:outer membrane protein assembly factor BamB/sterol desaturase/sphingolipid hydroxylase (fatty acid hydroxylase superfamily)